MTFLWCRKCSTRKTSAFKRKTTNPERRHKIKLNKINKIKNKSYLGFAHVVDRKLQKNLTKNTTVERSFSGVITASSRCLAE